MAAYDADLPAGVTRTIYLCDDGKDPEKRRWVASMGPEVGLGKFGSVLWFKSRVPGFMHEFPSVSNKGCKVEYETF